MDLLEEEVGTCHWTQQHRTMTVGFCSISSCHGNEERETETETEREGERQRERERERERGGGSVPGRLHAATLETSGRLFGLCTKHVSRLFGWNTVVILYTLSVQVHVQSERSRRLRAGTKLFRVTIFKSKMPFLGLLKFKMYLVVCRVLRSGGGWGSRVPSKASVLLSPWVTPRRARGGSWAPPPQCGSRFFCLDWFTHASAI